MTQEEWQEHRQTMRSLEGAEREQYRREWHARMVERAKEQGITLPGEPPASRGQGSGSGGSKGKGGPGGGRMKGGMGGHP